MRSSLLIVVSCLLAAACQGSSGALAPSTPQPPPASRGVSLLADLAGAYDVTITIPESCALAAAMPAVLTYGATIEVSSWSYLPVSIGTTARGDLWAQGTDSVRLSLNNFDIGGCDGTPEVLSDGRLFNICGTGILSGDRSTLSGTVDGSTWIGTPAVGGTTCSGPHLYRFTRR